MADASCEFLLAASHCFRAGAAFTVYLSLSFYHLCVEFATLIQTVPTHPTPWNEGPALPPGSTILPGRHGPGK